MLEGFGVPAQKEQKQKTRREPKLCKRISRHQYGMQDMLQRYDKIGIVSGTLFAPKKGVTPFYCRVARTPEKPDRKCQPQLCELITIGRYRLSSIRTK